MLLSSVCITFAPKGYHEPPEGPDTILTNWSAFAIVATIANADQFVRMVSGPSGGSWYPLGAKVMQTLESNIKGISTSNTSGGGISNVMSVNGGDAEIGWSYAHTVANGWNAKGKFKKIIKM